VSKLDINLLSHIVTTLHDDIKNYEHFIETGTFVGETIQKLQPYFKKLSTIELSLDLYLHFNTTIQNCKYQNVKNYLGDSIITLPGLLLSSGTENSIFWLDGHYSGQTWAGETALGIKECPLLEECSYIDKFCKSKKCIVLIDDCSLFGRKEHFDWSDITIQKICDKFKNYSIKKTKVFDVINDPIQWQGDIFSLALEK